MYDETNGCGGTFLPVIDIIKNVNALKNLHPFENAALDFNKNILENINLIRNNNKFDKKCGNSINVKVIHMLIIIEKYKHYKLIKFRGC